MTLKMVPLYKNILSLKPCKGFTRSHGIPQMQIDAAVLETLLFQVSMLASMEGVLKSL